MEVRGFTDVTVKVMKLFDTIPFYLSDYKGHEGSNV